MTGYRNDDHAADAGKHFWSRWDPLLSRWSDLATIATFVWLFVVPPVTSLLFQQPPQVPGDQVVLLQQVNQLKAQLARVQDATEVLQRTNAEIIADTLARMIVVFEGKAHATGEDPEAVLAAVRDLARTGSETARFALVARLRQDIEAEEKLIAIADSKGWEDVPAIGDGFKEVRRVALAKKARLQRYLDVLKPVGL